MNFKFICLIGLIFFISNKFSDGIFHNDQVIEIEDEKPISANSNKNIEQKTNIEIELKQNERENLDRLKTTSTSTTVETQTGTAFTTATTVTKATTETTPPSTSTTTTTTSSNTNELNNHNNEFVEACSSDECIVRDNKKLILNDRINHKNSHKIQFNKNEKEINDDFNKQTQNDELGVLNLENEPAKSNLDTDTKENLISEDTTEQQQTTEQMNINDTETSLPSSTLAETKTQSSFVVGVVVGKPDMQSFEEWKEMKLKEIPESSTTSNTISPSSSTSSQTVNAQHSIDSANLNQQIKLQQQQQQQQQNIKKQMNNNDNLDKLEEPVVVISRRKNYAGIDCGAKIIENNPESSNPSHILSESKDDYMLNSCSSKVWFVIELCEPIKINEIELANFELFSNVPRQFRVYTSERYIKSSSNNYNWPSKYLFGTFEASNVRAIQTFTPKDALPIKEINNDIISSNNNNNNMGENGNSNGIHSTNGQILSSYVKYVKFEMLSHYGTEHYCPISLVRIYGTTKGEDTISTTDEVVVGNTFIMVDSNIENANIDLLNKQNNYNNNNINLNGNKLSQEQKEEDLSKITELEIKTNSNKSTNQLFEMTSNFLSNVISTLMKENFNLGKLFDCFANTLESNKKINTKLNGNKFAYANDRNMIELNLIDKPSKSTRIVDTKHVVLNESNKHYKIAEPSMIENDEYYKQLAYNLNERNQIIQMDLHKVLCFSGNSQSSSINIGNEKLDCCQCISEQQSNYYFRFNKMNVQISDGAYNWLSKYCGYYFLMTTAAKARSNESLLSNYLNNMKYYVPLSNDSENENTIRKSVLNNNSFTHISINSIDYFILNEWLDKQALKVSLNKSKLEIGDRLTKNTNKNEEKEIEKSTKTDENKQNESTSTTVSVNDKTFVTEANKIENSKVEIVGADDMEKILSQNDESISENEIKTTQIESNQVETKIISDKHSKNEPNSSNKFQPKDNILTETKTSIKEKDQDAEKGEVITTITPSNKDYKLSKSETFNEPDKSETEPVTISTTTTTKTDSTTPTIVATTHEKLPSVEDIKNSIDQMIKITNTNISPQIESTTSTTPTTSNPPSPMPINGQTVFNLKEDIFTHLNNRIKILEFNMSLSSQYLEKLSQHYRKQLDEMQKAFNLTTTALIDTIRVADERDIKQNERIMIIEKRLDKMQQTVDSLSTFLNEIQFQTNIIILTIIAILVICIVVQILYWIISNSKKKILKEKNGYTCNLNNTQPLKLNDNLTSTELEKLIEERVNKLIEKHINQLRSQEESRLSESSSQIKFETLGPALTNQMTSFKTANTSPSPSSDHLLHHSSSSTLLPSNTIFSTSDTDIHQQQQQQVAAAALVSTVSTVAVVAAVSIAAATASCSTLTQSPNEEKL